MKDRDLARDVEAVVEACNNDDAILNYLWMVMEGMEDGATVDDIVAGVFAGDRTRFEEARAATEGAWRSTAGGDHRPELIALTPGDRLVMFGPAQSHIYELLDTD